MSNLDPEGFTLHQAAQARDDFAQVMDGLGFVEAQPARLPTRRDQAFAPLKIMFGSADIGAALVILSWKRSCGIPLTAGRWAVLRPSWSPCC